MPRLCRDCDAILRATATCPACGGARIVSHPELFTLTLAHIDCDAFFAAIEKRDRSQLRDLPVIVGGGARGVVSTCCYIARLSGVRSAMPMFKARQLCPEAVVIRPDMAKYASAAQQIRRLLADLTPLVQPLSIDEAVLDLAGTQRLHGAAPAIVLSRLSRRVEQEVGITISIGLGANRLLAKLAAERGKPRGFCVIGAEAAEILAAEPLAILPGIGPALVKRLNALGIQQLGQLAALSDLDAGKKLGPDGPALAARARGQDQRPVRIERLAKSISAETTFAADLVELAALEAELWTLCETLGRRLHREALAAAGIVLKLKSGDFVSRTCANRLPNPTQLPETLFESARVLLARAAGGTRYRLIGIAANPLTAATQADQGDLADTTTSRRRARQTAIDRLRGKFGEAAVRHGRVLPNIRRQP